MALKKNTIDLSSQLSSINNMSVTGMSEAQSSELKDIPAAVPGYLPREATSGQIVTKKKTVSNDSSVMVGFKLPKEAKEQYIEFFKQYGLNLSEAVKNALEYFAGDVQKGKVKITLTRHFERVEEE